MIDQNAHGEKDDSLDLPAPIRELSALYPARAEAEWDRLAAGIIMAASPELARRREERSVVRSILRLARPVGVAAAAVLLCGTIGLAVTSDAEATVTSSAPSFAEVVDREPASTLLAADRPPSASDLERVFESDSFPQVQP
jgi:hypothetical protein